MSLMLSDTNIPTLIVSKYDLGEVYPGIGYGSEGTVYNYNGEYALKTFSLFRAMEYFYQERVDLKFRKVEELSKLSDKSICFPLGIFGYRDLFMEGCYYPLITYEVGLKDFEDLSLVSNRGIQNDYLIKGDSMIKRAHDMGLIIGDVKADNIMINEDGNTVLVDVDNCAYGDYPFSLFPDRISVLENMYGKEFDYKDTDIMLYTMMSLRILFKDKRFGLDKTREGLDMAINSLPVNREIKEYISLLLSDAPNKPYVGPVLQKIHEYNK